MDVYFASLLQGYKEILEWVDEPAPLTKKYLDMFLNGTNKYGSLVFSRCPAIRDYCENVFVVTSPYDYEISWDGKDVTSSMWDQKFYDQVIFPRDLSIGFISFKAPYLHLFAEKSLTLEFMPAYFHDNEFTRKMLVLPGKFDIGQHFRRLEVACRFREPCTIRINRGDPLYYCKLHTQEKIQFKRFFVTEELTKLAESIIRMGARVNNYKPLEFYYNIFRKNNFRKTYLKLIRENLL